MPNPSGVRSSDECESNQGEPKCHPTHYATRSSLVLSAGMAEQTFEELNFAGQSRSINGSVRHLERAMEAHLRRATAEERDAQQVLDSRIEVVRRMLDRLFQLNP